MTFLEKEPNDTDRVSKIRRIPYRITKKLEGSYKVNENSKQAMKKQFDKKKQNSQELKVGNNMWLEAKNIYSN